LAPSTISGVNRLPEDEKRRIYARILPPVLLMRFNLSLEQLAAPDSAQLKLVAPVGAATAEMSLYHRPGFPDPVLYGHITDTLNGQLHILLYVLNDPDGPRFDVDRMPDGSPTKFGILQRNLAAEQAAMQAGLAPGQVRRGLRMLGEAIVGFEDFVASLGHELYFVEPLYYHVAIVFEQYGFAYAKGRRRMEEVNAGFAPGGELIPRLDNSTPFRSPAAAQSIRRRSWAIHDGILGRPLSDVTMYKRIHQHAGVVTCRECAW
jgi:hypothetical protein